MNATAPPDLPVSTLPSADEFELSAGRLCLDLPNTLNRRPTVRPVELLRSYGHLLAWARLAGVLDDDAARALRARADEGPKAADAVLRRAIALREATYAAMHAIVSERPVPGAALATINAEVARAGARAIVVPVVTAPSGGAPAHGASVMSARGVATSDAFRTGGSAPGASVSSFVWGWDDAAPALDRPLWPVARSLAELLTSDELPRVRECAADNCAWLFIDTSKNRSRRWCDMAVCGNRAKARRHYARARGA